MKKLNIFISIFVIIFLINNIFIFQVKAVNTTATENSNVTTKFEVVEENICKIDLTDYSHFEKKLISKDLNKRQVTLQLRVTNDSKKVKPTGELMIVLDNSESMNDELEDGRSRYEAIVSSANTLVDNLLKDNDNLKIGIVSFSSNIDVSKEGTSEDAKLISSFKTNASDLKSDISNIKFEGARTDLDSGITLASKQFTSDKSNKYMIILTDGVPNIALDYNKNYYSDDVISKTNSKLASLSNNNISIFTMLTGIGDSYEAQANPSDKTYGEIIEEIFGTTEKPTAGKYYYIQDENIEKTVTQDIYNDLQPASQTINNIKIVDYFPKEIINNFDFAYINSPNIGNISAKVDTTNNSITWTINKLESQETATVQYTLTLKDDYDSAIVDKILDTNEKVVITFDDENGKSQEKESDDTPKVRITEKINNPAPKDNTVAPKILPKTGSKVIAITLFVVAVIAIALGVRFNILNKNMKD